LLTCAHPAWKSTSAPLFFCTSGKETVVNLKISHGQLAPCQEGRIKGQQTVSSAGYNVLASNAGFLLASMPSYCRFRPIECCYSQSVSVSVPKDNIRGSAIHRKLNQRYKYHSGLRLQQRARRHNCTTRCHQTVPPPILTNCTFPLPARHHPPAPIPYTPT